MLLKYSKENVCSHDRLIFAGPFRAVLAIGGLSRGRDWIPPYLLLPVPTTHSTATTKYIITLRCRSCILKWLANKSNLS